MSKKRIAVFDCGLHTDVFLGYSPLLEIPSRTGSILPKRFDILIIPFHTDQVFLGSHRQELEEYVENGGIVLVFGACDLAQSDWIPFCKWTSEYTSKTHFDFDSEAGKQIFKELKPSDMRFHTKYHAHGSLIPSRPEKTEIIAAGEKDRPVMVLIKPGKIGAALITTIDPDHHSSLAVAGPGKMTTETARGKAQKLFHNIINYAKDLSDRNGSQAIWEVADPKKIFLSHAGTDKPLVREFNTTLTNLGHETWFDENTLNAGSGLERDILKGMQESCAVVFFITPNFADENWLKMEIDFAVAEKRKREDYFAIITLVFSDETQKNATVPALIKQRYVYKEPQNYLEGLRVIVHSLPITLGPVVWK